MSREKQLRTINSYGLNWRESTDFGVVLVKSECKVKGKLGQMIQT